ncbi:Ig-like domain-containing protein [Listeria sp. PSOL-1]|uniref:Ig-like domain-containing protein n=1 Tax=Listeria sp. PSOL-1 TaxID=1844999 RepID=UPI0013D8C93D|nr:Ig-like domain-containing protein [Listeria sp. PSOL-1]
MEKKTFKKVGIGFVAILLFVIGGAFFQEKDIAAKSIIPFDLLEGDFNVAKDWQILDYSSDLKASLSLVFLEDKESKVGGTKLNAALCNFANIGNAKFKARKSFHLKKGRTYNLKWYYGFRTTGKAKASIDFNGTKKTSSSTLNQDVYTETIVSDKEQDYVITLEFNAPKVTNVYMMIGYDAADPNKGMEEEKIASPTVEAPEAGQRTVLGTGVVGNSIRVTDQNDVLLGTSLVEANGTYTIVSNRTLVYDEVINVTQVADDGITSTPTTVKVIDSYAPEAPKVDGPVEWKEQTVRGSAEKGSRIEVRNEAQELVGNGVANGQPIDGTNNKFSVELTKTVPIGSKLFVTAVDAANNTSNATETTVVNNYKPDAPQVNEVTDTDTVVTGKGYKAGNKITAVINNQEFEGIVQEDLTFSIDIGRAFPGKTEIKVTETDAAERTSDPTTVKVKGTIKTATPQVNPVGDSDTEITGKAEAGADVSVVIANSTYTGKANNEGDFKISLNQRYPAGTKGTLFATGRSSVPSDEISFTVLDKTAPEKPSINKMIDTDTVITGKSEAGAKMRIELTKKDGEISVYETIATETGSYSLTLTTTYQRGTKIAVTATDTAGNVSDKTASKVLSSVELEMFIDPAINSQDTSVLGTTSRSNSYYQVKIGNRIYEGYSDDEGQIEFELDRSYPVGTSVDYFTRDEDDTSDVIKTVVIPRSPTQTSLFHNQTEITNMVDPFANITITVNGTEIYNAIADQDGNFSITLKRPLEIGDEITIIQEVNGYSSQPATIWVY